MVPGHKLSAFQHLENPLLSLDEDAALESLPGGVIINENEGVRNRLYAYWTSLDTLDISKYCN